MVKMGTLAILMGVVILLADLYWMSISLTYALGLALGVIILVADVVWLAIDWSMMKK